MNKLPRRHRFVFPLTLILVLGCALATQVSGQDKPAADSQPKSPEIPKFVVSGRVVYDNSERPVRRAQISLAQLPEQGSAGEYTSATDRDGRFAIAGVPAGVYFAFVNSPGIITPLAFASLAETGPSDSLDLKAIKEYCSEVVVDASDVDVTIRARRGGAISGKVTYGDGEPAVNADVAIIRRTNNRATRVLTGLNATALLALHTDDRGRYRVSGLPPGEYTVSASEKNTAPQSRANRGYGMDELFGSGDALTVTYHGGSTDPTDAIKLQVGARSELTDIDISLPDTTPHTIRGSVLAKLDRIPLPGATVAIRIKDQPAWFERGARQISTDEQGQWAAEDIPDGTYILRVELSAGLSIPGAKPTVEVNEEQENFRGRLELPTRKFVPSEIQVSVAGGDVVVEPIALAEGASISGTIQAPTEFKEVLNRSYFQIAWRYEGDPPLTHYRNSTAVFSDQFSITGLREGKVHLNGVFGYGSQGDEAGKYYVKSITLNGADVMHKPIFVKEGQSISDVRVVIAEGKVKATIKLVTADGKPGNSRRLAVIPVEQSRWLFTSEMIAGTSDGQGQMSFSCAPGEYYVIVSTTDVWPPTFESIKQHSADAARIKISPGENKTFVVPVPGM
ncbi:MAG TPA: carboxypeptidase regulatory-like domain-containing protein [Pyrinomonadaceae bacterium]|nr:carboxypeptidase regulatory-like domain-containing protein [Pyrinomonadaceae bacterium]